MSVIYKKIPSDLVFPTKDGAAFPEKETDLATVKGDIYRSEGIVFPSMRTFKLLSVSFARPAKAWKILGKQEDQTLRLGREMLHALLISATTYEGVDGVWQNPKYKMSSWWHIIPYEGDFFEGDGQRGLVHALIHKLNHHYHKNGQTAETRFQKTTSDIEAGVCDDDLKDFSPMVARSVLAKAYTPKENQPNGHFYRRVALFERIAQTLKCDGIELVESKRYAGNIYLFPEVFVEEKDEIEMPRRVKRMQFKNG